jgi:isopentenyl-diphosphate delta-isomerase
MLASRKEEHLRICLEEDVRPRTLTTGLERYRFVHQALPEMDLEEVDLRTLFLGKQLDAPLLISSMTGGTASARAINRRLGEAAQALGIGMCVGSQRAALEDPATIETYRVRDCAPDVLLLANLGAVQLAKSYTIDHCRRAVDMIEADALILHLNPLQEALQPEGDTHFRGLLDKIEAVCRGLSVPVIVKEVGYGISAEVAQRLIGAGVSALDVAGGGGTSWSEVERNRTNDPVLAGAAAQFIDWGIPTAECIRAVRGVAPSVPLIASGGVETGIDVAKCVALGADVVALAWPLLRPSLVSTEAVAEAVQTIVRTLRVAMFCVGAPDVAALRLTPHLQEVGV